jgi:hypothetical protein
MFQAINVEMASDTGQRMCIRLTSEDETPIETERFINNKIQVQRAGDGQSRPETAYSK